MDALGLRVWGLRVGGLGMGIEGWDHIAISISMFFLISSFRANSQQG